MIFLFYTYKSVGDYIQLYTTKYKKLFLYINNNSYVCAMRLVEQHTIKQSSVYYNELYDLLHKCKNKTYTIKDCMLLDNTISNTRMIIL